MNTHTTSIRRAGGVLLGTLVLAAAWPGVPAAADVKVRVDGRQQDWDVFTSAGSSYSYVGS